MVKTIGIVGIGRMGAGLALSIRRKGFEVLFVRHRSSTTPERLLQAGCTEVGTLTDLVNRSDALILCLPSSREVEQTLQQLGSSVRPASGIVLDCTSSLPAETVGWAGTLETFDIHLYDAPLTRGPREAEEGRLRCITSCSGAHWSQVQTVVESFSEDVVHVARVGEAHQLKLINNLLSMGQLCLAVDGLTVAQQTGSSLAALQQVVAGGAASSQALSGLLQYLDGDHGVLNFKIESALKDVRYALSNEALTDAALRMAHATEATLSAAAEQGLGGEPLPALLRWAGVASA
jgi:3-hydroxyisobutyrate dehydrogenase